MDLKKLAEDLLAAGQLTNFMEAMGQLDPLINCSAILPPIPVGPAGKSPTANIHIRQMTLHKRGSTNGGSIHPYDHFSVVIGRTLRKSWKLDAEGKEIPETVREVIVGACKIIEGQAIKDEGGFNIGHDGPGFAAFNTARDNCHQYTAMDDTGAVVICCHSMQVGPGGTVIPGLDPSTTEAC